MNSVQKLDTQTETLPDSAEFSDLRDVLMAEAHKSGVACPLCEQFVKIYRRGIGATDAVQLIKLLRVTGGDTTKEVHVDDFVDANGGDFAKLRFWGLINLVPKNPNSTKTHSGRWTITEKGIAFCRQQIKIPRHAMIFDSKFFGFVPDEEPVDIVHCLKRKFNIHDLMAGLQ